jgi:hypothetical protein
MDLYFINKILRKENFDTEKKLLNTITTEGFDTVGDIIGGLMAAFLYLVIFIILFCLSAMLMAMRYNKYNNIEGVLAIFWLGFAFFFPYFYLIIYGILLDPVSGPGCFGSSGMARKGGQRRL